MLHEGIQTERAPTTVVLVSVILFMATAVSFLTGISLLFPDLALNRIWDLNKAAYIAFQRLGGASGFLLLAVGALATMAGAGLLLRRRWAWYLAICLFGINGFGDFVAAILFRDRWRSGMGVVIACIFLFCLLKSNTRKHFENTDNDF